MTTLIEVITDSTCDIPADLIEKYDITVLPQTLIWNGKQYRDRVDMQADDFYRRLKVEIDMPTTSQITEGGFARAIESAWQRGVQEILLLTVSSSLSGTYQSALNAARSFNLPVHVFDSKSVSMGLGWQVLAAARALANGGGLKVMIEAAERVRRKVELVVCMPTLKYIASGGRIGNARRLIGTMLDVKPLVWVNHHTGIVEPLATARTYKKAVEVCYQKFFERLDLHGKAMRVAVLHGGALEEAHRLAEHIRQEFNPLELLINSTGPILGRNTGPGSLGLCGYIEE